MFLRSAFSTLKAATPPSTVKSNNAALLDALNELIGTGPKNTGLVSGDQSSTTIAKGIRSNTSSTSMGTVELAPEFNLNRAEAEMLRQTTEGQRLSNQARFRFNPPASMIYQASELLAPTNRPELKPIVSTHGGMASPFADPNLEVRRSVDIFRRNKYNNVFLLSSFLSASGKIMHRSKTGLSSKTQRHISKVIRRARQMGKQVAKIFRSVAIYASPHCSSSSAAINKQSI